MSEIDKEEVFEAKTVFAGAAASRAEKRFCLTWKRVSHAGREEDKEVHLKVLNNGLDNEICALGSLDSIGGGEDILHHTSDKGLSALRRV